MLKAIFIFIACFLSFYVFAQDLIIKNNQKIVVHDTNQATNKSLEVEKVYIKSRLSLSMYFLGIGTIQFNHVVPGLQSCTRFKQSDNIVVLIKSDLDSVTLLKGINVFRLKQDNKRLYRYMEFKKWTTFTGNTYADNDSVGFTINKRNNNLYSLEFQTNLSAGEYAIRLPNNTESLKLFGID